MVGAIAPWPIPASTALMDSEHSLLPISVTQVSLVQAQRTINGMAVLPGQIVNAPLSLPLTPAPLIGFR